MRRSPRRRAPLSFRFVPKATDGGIDQTITVENHTETSLVPTVRYVARDFYGRELPNVTTRTVHGSDRGELLLPAGATATDVLRFDGPGERAVRVVDIELVGLEEDDHPALVGPTRAVMIDLEQRATADPTEFWGIGLVNPNPFGVRMRISLLEIEERVHDHPRQVTDVVTLQEDVRGRYEAVVHHLVPQVLV